MTCEHNTSIILHTTPGYEIALCTWGCGQHLVNVTNAGTRITRIWTVTEMIAAVTPICLRCGKMPDRWELDECNGLCYECFKAQSA
jgi:hypothetical protein